MTEIVDCVYKVKVYFEDDYIHCRLTDDYF